MRGGLLEKIGLEEILGVEPEVFGIAPILDAPNRVMHQGVRNEDDFALRADAVDDIRVLGRVQIDVKAADFVKGTAAHGQVGAIDIVEP